MSPLSKAASSDPAAWIVEGLHGFAHDVGSLVPAVFEAYARVFHPAGTGYPEDRPVRWSEVAASTGRTFHGAAQWSHVAFTSEVKDENDLQNPPAGAPWASRPEEGSLDRPVAERLIDRLRPHTSTPESCWFAFWDGWGVPFPLTSSTRSLFGRRKAVEPPEEPGLKELRERWDAPSFSIDGRDLLLFSGTLDDATEGFYEPMNMPHFQSAYFWWPDDHAWLITTEIDFDTTYVGGSRACIDAVVGDDLLEALEVRIDQGVSSDPDSINPNPMRQNG